MPLRVGPTGASPSDVGAAAQPQGLERGQPEPSDRPSHIAERVAAGITVGLGIVGRPDTDAVENDDCGASHQALGMVCTNRNRSAVTA